MGQQTKCILDNEESLDTTSTR